MTYHVLEESEWDRYRQIRLRALRECPDAFGSTLEMESSFSERDWRRRLSNPEAITIVAAEPSGGDIALVSGAPYDDVAGLYSLWVAPEWRGQGIGAHLVRLVIEWARRCGKPKIFLDVGDWNEGAIALYRSMGFSPTGSRKSLPPPREHIMEHQRVRLL